MQNRLIVRQLFDSQSGTYSYILADPHTSEAILIDSVFEQVDRDLQIIAEMGLILKFVVETHIHADHITGAGLIRKKTSAPVVHGQAMGCPCADISLKDGETISFGTRKLEAISTPGHTNGCTSYSIEGFVFTGDTLMIRSCGRTDLQEGSSETLFESVTQKLYKLPPETIMYPGHDYLGRSCSTIEEEMKYNPRISLNTKKADFVNYMNTLDLPLPKKINVAVPANTKCGDINFHEITPEDLHRALGTVTVVDVRTPKEFEEGYIDGAVLAPLGRDLMHFLNTADKDKDYVFVCRSGRRSGEAADAARNHDFIHALNLKGGMQEWVAHKYPIIHPKSK